MLNQNVKPVSDNVHLQTSVEEMANLAWDILWDNRSEQLYAICDSLNVMGIFEIWDDKWIISMDGDNSYRLSDHLGLVDCVTKALEAKAQGLNCYFIILNSVDEWLDKVRAETHYEQMELEF